MALLDLAHQEPCEVEIVDGHVQEGAAARQQELQRGRGGVPGGRAELPDPAHPARGAASSREACVVVGVTITTASTAGSRMASYGSVEARWARARSRPRLAA